MKKKRYLIILLLILIKYDVNAQSRYNLLYEQNLGMNTGAENINSIYYLWSSFDNRFIPKTVSKNSKAANVGFRLGKFFLLDYPITFMLPTVQHELFGHGSRILELNGSIDKVSITLPPPFQLELPYISYTPNWNTTFQQNLLIHTGGSEGNTILGDIVRKNILLDNELDYHSAFLYIYANNDLAGYAAFAAGLSDISGYIIDINGIYPADIQVRTVRLYGLLGIVLDPMNYYAFNSVFNGYIWQGKTKSNIHLIDLPNNLSYLPKLKFTLTPYGPEFILQNYLKQNDRLYAISFGMADGTFENSWRIGAEAWNIAVNEKWWFNFSTQIWHQPKIEFYTNDILESSENLGALAIATANYDVLSKDNRLGLTVQLGYKSSGFALGERLDSGLILRGGLSFRLK
jgi:hypothetical protein